MVTVEGDGTPHDPNGVDVESVVRTAEGTFRLSEEYAPGLLELGASGETLARYVPETMESDLSEASYPVGGALPEIFKRRNRGVESVGLAPDDSTVWFAHRSPLATPDVAAFEESPNRRLGAFDPESEAVSGRYLYRPDEPGAFRKDSDAGEVVRDDVEVSERPATDEDRLLVPERISLIVKFCVVSDRRRPVIRGAHPRQRQASRFHTVFLRLPIGYVVRLHVGATRGDTRLGPGPAAWRGYRATARATHRAYRVSRGI